MVLQSYEQFENRKHLNGLDEGDIVVLPLGLGLRYVKDALNHHIFNIGIIGPAYTFHQTTWEHFFQIINRYDKEGTVEGLLKATCIIKANDVDADYKIGIDRNDLTPLIVLFGLNGKPNPNFNNKVKVEKKEDRTLFITPEVTLEVMGEPKYEII